MGVRTDAVATSVCFTLPQAVPVFPCLVPTPTLRAGEGKDSYAHFTDQKIKSRGDSQGWGLPDAAETFYLEEVGQPLKPEVAQEVGGPPPPAPRIHLRPRRLKKDIWNVGNYLPANGLEGSPC